MIRRITGTLAVVVLALLAFSGVAQAHGGPIALDIRSDGGQRITASVAYVRDGHAVPDEVVMTYTAVSTEGKTIGPAPMVASNEGRAFYLSKDALPLGDWTVTVTATKPSAATKTINVTSAVLPDPAVSATPAPSGGSSALLIGLPVGVAVVGLVVVFVVRNKKRARVG